MIKVMGFDPSLRNWGIAYGSYSIESGIAVDKLSIIQTESDKGKQTRQNSKDINTAMQLFESAYEAAKGIDAVFVEVPVGSQSSRAMASYGVCIGVLGALCSLKVPVYEVTPTEVKLSTVGTKTASKEEMIAWAYNKYPEINWPKSYAGSLITSKAEHMADAVGAIYAGVHSKDFQRMAQFILNNRKAI